MRQTTDRKTFRIDWDLHELGPRVEPLPEPEPEPVYRDIHSQLDFSRLDYGRAVAAGYVPANELQLDDEAA